MKLPISQKRRADVNEQLQRESTLLRIIAEQADEIEKLKKERSVLKANIRHKNVLLSCYRNTYMRGVKNDPE